MRQVETEKVRGDFEATKRRLETTSITSGAGASKAEKSAAEKEAAAEARKERERLQGSLGEKEEDLDETSRERGLAIRRRGVSSGNETLQTVGKALADGTNADELQKLGDGVREAAAKNGAAMTKALMDVIHSLNSQAQEIEVIKRQIKNKK